MQRINWQKKFLSRVSEMPSGIGEDNRAAYRVRTLYRENISVVKRNCDDVGGFFNVDNVVQSDVGQVNLVFG